MQSLATVSRMIDTSSSRMVFPLSSKDEVYCNAIGSGIQELFSCVETGNGTEAVPYTFFHDNDSLFDTLIPFISWKFCYLFPLTALVYLYQKRKSLKKPLLLFCTSPAFYMMCSAMFIFIPLAQAIGNRSFISTVLPDAHDIILMRRFIEESAEVLAYFLLLISSLEFYISLLKKSK